MGAGGVVMVTEGRWALARIKVRTEGMAGVYEGGRELAGLFGRKMGRYGWVKKGRRGRDAL